MVARREFANDERSLNVCILNRVAATLLFPNEDPLDRYVRPTDENEFPVGTTCRVIGKAENTKSSDVRQAPPAYDLLPSFS